MSRGWPAKAALAGAFVFAFVFGWTTLGPAQLGGGASYAVIQGSSMTPTLRSGDLAVLRSAADYGVGDVVGYRSAELGPVIVHRIIARDGDRLVLKGDGNAWTDGVHPSPSELIGELWLRAPGLGGVIVWLRSPLGLLLLGSIIVGAVLVWSRAPRNPHVSLRPANPQEPPSPAIRGFTAAAICFLLLGVVAFTRPASGQTSFALPFVHEGRFAYAAASAPGIYEGSGATTGDPIFLRVAPSMEVSFSYKLDAAGARSVAGTTQLVAEVADANGWKRTIQVQPLRPFSGMQVTASGPIDLRLVWDTIRRIEMRTGVPHGGYTLSVVPEVRVHGIINTKAFGDEFTPRLGFRLEPLQLVMDVPAGSPASSVLTPTKSASVRGSHVAPRTLKLLGAEVPMPAARIASITGLTLNLAAAVIAARRRRPRRRKVDPDVIRERYGEMILPVRSAGVTAFRRVIEIDDIDLLAQLAERGSGIIFHEHRDGKHSYLTPEGDVAYRCIIEAEGDDAGFDSATEPPPSSRRVASPRTGR